MQQDARVGLIDADGYGFSERRMFGAASPAATDAAGRIEPWRRHGVELLSMGMFVGERHPVMRLLGKAMRKFFERGAGAPRLPAPHLPPGTGDTALEAAQHLPAAQISVVTTCQPVAAQVATRAGALAVWLSQGLSGVIENMSYAVCPSGERWGLFGRGVGQALARVGVPLLVQVPLDVGIRAGPAGVPRGDAPEASRGQRLAQWRRGAPWPFVGPSAPPSGGPDASSCPQRGFYPGPPPPSPGAPQGPLHGVGAYARASQRNASKAAGSAAAPISTGGEVVPGAPHQEAGGVDRRAGHHVMRVTSGFGCQWLRPY